jgi:hypothetical protein
VIDDPTGLDRMDVGLGNVDNTSDANKPISNATQTSLDQKEDKINKGQNGGYAGLDAAGKVPLQQMPQSVLGANVYQGTWNAATNTPAIPVASINNQGWYWVVSVAGSTNIDGISTWAPGDWIISNGTAWERVINIDSVSSVNTKTGAVVINKTDVGLSNVDNTSDATKNAAVATLTNKTLTTPVINSPTGLVKADVGLGNVDNTSDATKNAASATLTNKTIDGANNTLRVRLDTTDVVNNLPVSHLNGGSGANTGTFWRGDGQWGTPAGGGDVTGPAGAVDGEVAQFSGSTGKLLKRLSDIGTILPVGSVVQIVIAQYSTWHSTNVILPADNTIPQSNEGLELPLPVIITPRYDNSVFDIQFSAPFYILASNNVSAALFRNTATNAIAMTWANVGSGATGGSNLLLNYRDPAQGSLAPITYKIRYGPGAAGTVWINGTSSSGVGGGVLYASLRVQEIKQ